MTPQLFINYKLKSVAHLPWRMMTYKALNTFIDDIFAFVIKMPILYRIGCFRDGKSIDKYMLSLNNYTSLVLSQCNLYSLYLCCCIATALSNVIKCTYILLSRCL